MSINTNIRAQQYFSISPTDAVRGSVGDGAPLIPCDNTPAALAVAKLEGAPGNIYYYSTTFSGGPGDKCPPDIRGGSSGCVTGSQAPTYTRPGPAQAQGPPTPSHSPQSYSSPSLPPINVNVIGNGKVPTGGRPAPPLPLQIPKPRTAAPLPSPPKTPSPDTGSAGANPLHSRASVLDFLARVFPRSAMTLLPHTRGVEIASHMEGQTALWDGAVLALPGMERALYVDGAGVENVHLKECVVALLELADEHLHCTSLVIALDKTSPDLGEVLHAMMYVGGTVVSRPPFPTGRDYILVGINL